MDRKQLKTVFQGINAGDTLTVNFGGTRGTETLKVLNKCVWKGKGGSLLAECLNTATNEKLNIGTFSADQVVNIAVNDGETVGLPVGTSLPKVYKTDAAKTVALKTQFLGLMSQLKTATLTVEVEAASAPELEGKFTVKNIRRTPGRNGPVVMDLVSLTDGKTESTISSSRHSGVIDRIIVSSEELESTEDTEI